MVMLFRIKVSEVQKHVCQTTKLKPVETKVTDFKLLSYDRNHEGKRPQYIKTLIFKQDRAKCADI